jgi:hypothetical protein
MSKDKPIGDVIPATPKVGKYDFRVMRETYVTGADGGRWTSGPVPYGDNDDGTYSTQAKAEAAVRIYCNPKRPAHPKNQTRGPGWVEFAPKRKWSKVTDDRA